MKRLDVDRLHKLLAHPEWKNVVGCGKTRAVCELVAGEVEVATSTSNIAIISEYPLMFAVQMINVLKEHGLDEYYFNPDNRYIRIGGVTINVFGSEDAARGFLGSVYYDDDPWEALNQCKK